MSFSCIRDLFIVLFCAPPIVYAQDHKNIFENSTITIQTHYGSFLTAVPKAFFLKDSYSYYTEVGLSKPIKGIFKRNNRNIPEWGIAIFYGSTGSKEYIGTMEGIFPFINFKVLSFKKFTSSIRTGLGLGIIQKPYDLQTNHKNILIGSHGNVFINALWKNQLEISDHLAINAGISFSHLSNGNTKLPNLGLNIPAFTGGISYTINKTSNKKNINHPDTIKKNLTRLDVTAYFGIKQAPWINSNRYFTGILTAEITKQKSAKGRYGAGIAIFLDPSVQHLYLDTIVTLGNTKRPVMNTGPFLYYEKIIGKLSIPIQLGIYVFDSEAGRFFQNLGFRYKINNHFSADAGLLAHWGKADFLHAGINYSF